MIARKLCFCGNLEPKWPRSVVVDVVVDVVDVVGC